MYISDYKLVFSILLFIYLFIYLSLFGNKLDFHSAEHGINSRSIMQSTSIYMQIPEPFCLLTSFLKIQELRSFPSLFCFVFLSIHFGQNVIISVDLDFLVVIVYIFVILTYINIIFFFLTLKVENLEYLISSHWGWIFADQFDRFLIIDIIILYS